MALVVFGVLAALLLIGALTVVLHPDSVYSALALVGVMALLAMVFVTLEAHLVAALQIIVYAGAIMVLFLFVIMLIGPPGVGGPFARGRALWVASGLGASALAIGVGTMVARSALAPPDAGRPEFGTTTAVARELFTTYLLPFELTSVLLLIAVVGAVVLAKGRPRA
jgi:NADH-quinone oxidoreductase subunit J